MHKTVTTVALVALGGAVLYLMLDKQRPSAVVVASPTPTSSQAPPTLGNVFDSALGLANSIFSGLKVRADVAPKTL